MTIVNGVVATTVDADGAILSDLMPLAELTITGNGSVWVWVVGERRVGGVCHP